MRVSPLLILLAACKPPPEAPEEVGALTRYLFSEFHAEDEEVVQVGAMELRTFLGTVDLEAGRSDRELTIAPLTLEDVGEITVPETFDPETQVAVAVSGISAHPFADSAIALTLEPNQVCIESDTTKYYARTFIGDTACFEDGTCGSLDSDNEVRKESLSDIWYDLNKEYRRFVLEDETEVLLARSWISEQAFTDNGNGSIEQSTTLEVWIENPDDPATTLRYYAMWSSVDISSIGPDLWGTLVTGGIDEGFENADTFIEGGNCSQDRDREYDRPEAE